MLTKFIKKLFIVLSVTSVISTAFITSSRADDSSSIFATNYEQIIANNTTGILQQVSSLLDFIQFVAISLLNMQHPDDSDITKTTFQGDFSVIGQAISNDNAIQFAILPQLTNDFFGPEIGQLSYANDLNYGTLLGQPILNPDPRNTPDPANPLAILRPDSAYNYIKNISGYSLKHIVPKNNWQGTDDSKNTYNAYYSTIMSIGSFNGYVLSNLYADQRNGNVLNKMQMDMVTQASSSDWIAQIASQEIGKVLRQILMFEAQTYVLMTELVQTQKQALAAQVMTNTLLTLLTKSQEGTLVNAAQGKKPGQ